MAREVWVVGEGFVEVNFSEGAWFYYYAAGWVAEHAVAGVVLVWYTRLTGNRQ